MTTLADRSLRAAPARPRALRGRRASTPLPELVREAGGARAFVVSRSGRRRAPGSPRRSSTPSSRGGRRRRRLFDEIEPNPARRRSCARGAVELLRRSGSTARSSSRSVAARRWTRPRSSRLHAANGGEVLALGYHREDLRPACPSSPSRRPPAPAPRPTPTASSPTRRPGARTTSGIRRVLPRWSLLDPALTVGVPPAATAATGVDALTHSLESLLSRNPNPFAEAIALQVIRTVRAWLPARLRRRRGPRGPVAAADGVAPGRRSGSRAGPASGSSMRSATRSGRAVAAPRPGPRRHRARGPGLLRGRAWPARPRAAPRRRRPRRRVADRDAGDRRHRRHRRAARLPRRARPAADAVVARLRRRGARRRRPGRHRRRGDQQLAAPAVVRGGPGDPGASVA